MRTIAIINQKGGCGKTTTSINLAAVLAAAGQRTLLVDMDPQSHCALGLAVPDAQIERSMADVLRSGLSGSVALSDVTWQIARNLDLAPSDMSLAATEHELTNARDKDRRLTHVLATVEPNYDFCIIDCPPSIGLLTFNALRAAGEIIVPVETGYFSMQGSMKQEATIEMLARRAGHHVRFNVLATMYDVRTKLAREILGELRRHFADTLLPVVVNFNSKLREAASFGQPITEYDPASRGMQDFEKLAQWLLDNPPPAVSAQAMDEAPGDAALSRAAELVERARALSERTATLAASLEADDDLSNERVVSPRLPMPQPNPLEHAENMHADAPTPPASRLDDKLQRLYGVRTTSQGVLFVQPAPTAHHIAIVGDFNDWSDRVTPMRRDGNLGVWQACVPLPPGRYHYKLVIDGQCVNDPYNTSVERIDNGDEANVVEVKVA